MHKKILALLAIVISVSFAGNITPRGMTQGDLYTLLDNVTKAQLYHTLGAPVLGIADGKATANTTTAIKFVNNGNICSLAASTNMKPVKTGLATSRFYRTSKITTNNYGVHVNAAGTVAVVNRANTNVQPGYVAGYTPIGVIEVGLTSTNTAGFLFGTTLWNAASQNVVVRQVNAFTSGANKLSLQGLNQ